MQRQSSDESYSSPNSSPKTHHRSSSFNGMPSLDFGSSDSISIKSAPTKEAENPLSVSWSSVTIPSSRADMADCSPESKMISRKTLGGGEDASFRVLELIRQLSFSPIRETKTKKRTNTAETEVGSSFDSDSSDRHHILIGLDLELDLDLREAHPLRRSPSPLLGLKYLPEEDFI